MAPALFKHIVPWADVEPVSAAAVYGAIVGVLLGGGLAVFAITISTLANWIKLKGKT